MIVKYEGHELEATVDEYRCRDFVAVSLWVNNRLVPLPDTFSRQYRLVQADQREKEMLRGWGYRLEGL